MTIEQFKTFALQTMCEAHLWKIGESNTFTLRVLTTKLSDARLGGRWRPGTKFGRNGTNRASTPMRGRLFNHLFSDRAISFN